mmetsp:Transcript_4823/g.9889  ORF Transcript_4823/g.9889 Transcript_4823/m.9889 type:complete len:175 (-) Transcript_4823:94-618(-)
MPPFASSPATATIINLHVVLVSPGGLSSGRVIIHDAIPIPDASMSLLEILREEVVRVNSSVRYSDDDIKSAKSTEKRHSIIRLLSFSVATALSSISDESPKDITIKPAVVLNPTKKAQCPFELMKESSRLNSSKFSSKFSHSKVQDFLIGFETAPSKLAFLEEYPSAKKPSFHD